MHDKVIDAVRKVRLVGDAFKASHTPRPCALSRLIPCPQMTRGNVGSLLVFDPEKLKPTDHPIREAEGDAVMGIVTERGTQTSRPAAYLCVYKEYRGRSLWNGAGNDVCGVVPDYLTKVVVMGKSSAELPVSEIMTPQSKLMTVSPSQSVVEVMELMIDNNFRHVPVVSACFPPLSFLCAWKGGWQPLHGCVPFFLWLHVVFGT